MNLRLANPRFIPKTSRNPIYGTNTLWSKGLREFQGFVTNPKPVATVNKEFRPDVATCNGSSSRALIGKFSCETVGHGTTDVFTSADPTTQGGGARIWGLCANPRPFSPKKIYDATDVVSRWPVNIPVTRLPIII